MSIAVPPKRQTDPRDAERRPAWGGLLARHPTLGLLAVIVLLAAVVAAVGGNHPRLGNRLFNPSTLMEMATQASFFAIMATGMTLVIVTAGIDLSVGAVYALAGVGAAMLLRDLDAAHLPAAAAVMSGLAIALGIGLACGLANGLMIVGLGVHPFVITLGMMWMVRGLAFVLSDAQSILVPDALTHVAKASLGLGRLHPVPLLAMALVTGIGAVYLGCTVMGRHVYALGGNPEASRYAGLPIGRITVGVYAISGLCAGLAAFLGISYYGAAACADGTGYELYVIAAAVVGGTSLAGGKGSVPAATLGAVLIVLIRQSIVILGWNQKYEWILVGVSLIVAVVLDRVTARLAMRRAAAIGGRLLDRRGANKEGSV
jgi:ribose transport system permease protein